MKKWNLNSWTKLPAKHLPVYQDKGELDLIKKKIPSFSFCRRVKIIKESLAQGLRVKHFYCRAVIVLKVLQNFIQINTRYFKVLYKLVLTASASVPVVKVGRIAGQFSNQEAHQPKKDGKELPSYLGDNINGMEFTEKARIRP